MRLYPNNQIVSVCRLKQLLLNSVEHFFIVPFVHLGAELLFKCFQSALRTQFHPGHIQSALSRMDQVLGPERLTGSLLDRLTCHLHILGMNGDSYRRKQTKRKPKSQPVSA